VITEPDRPIPFDADLVRHRGRVRAAVENRQVLHGDELAQIPDAAVDDDALCAGHVHADARHIAEERRAIDHSTEFNDDDVTWLEIFPGANVVLISVSNLSSLSSPSTQSTRGVDLNHMSAGRGAGQRAGE
jgi:hypothetical protein